MYGSGRASSSTRNARRGRRVVVRVAGHGGVGTRIEEDVLDQVEALSEVIERGDVPGDRQHRVGKPEVVGRHVGESLDLAHDVVAEIADDTTVERW